jgi:hypothetical protein
MINLLNSDFIFKLDYFIIAALLLLVVLSVWESSNGDVPGVDSNGNNSEPGNNNKWWKLLLFLFAINLGITAGILFEQYGESLIPGSNGYLPPSVAIFGGALVHFLIFISQALQETLFIDFTRLINSGFFMDSSLVFMRNIVELEIPGVENLDDFFVKLCDSNLIEISFLGDRIIISDFYKNEMSCLVNQLDIINWVYFRLVACFENDVSYESLQEGFYFFFNLYCSKHSLVLTEEEKEFYFYLFIKAIVDRNTLLVYQELFG